MLIINKGEKKSLLRQKRNTNYYYTTQKLAYKYISLLVHINIIIVNKIFHTFLFISSEHLHIAANQQKQSPEKKNIKARELLLCNNYICNIVYTFYISRKDKINRNITGTRMIVCLWHIKSIS